MIFVTAIDCAALSEPTNGALSCNRDKAVQFPSYSDKCNLACDAGFVLTSSGALQCGGTTNPGVWNPATVPTCQGKWRRLELSN